MLRADYYEDFYFSFVQSQYRYYKKIFAEDQKCIYKDVGLFPEIIFGAGLFPAIIEVVVGMLPPTSVNESVLNKADRYFYNNGACSFNKFALPALEAGVLPIPKAFASVSVCQETSNNFSMLANKYKLPHLTIDYPYSYSKEALQYLKKQYSALFESLCSIAGHPIDIDRLKECIKKSNEAVGYLNKANELRKHAPALIYGGQMLKFINIMTLLGDDDAISIAKEYYEFCKYKIENKIFPPNQKYRILWCNLGPVYDNYFYEYMEGELGAVIAFEEINAIAWTQMNENNPFESLAEKTFQVHFAGDVHKRIKHLLQLVEDYKIDGVVFFSHMNCRMFNPKFHLIKQAFNREGIPIVELSGDCFDKRNYNRAQLITRLEAFVEML